MVLTEFAKKIIKEMKSYDGQMGPPAIYRKYYGKEALQKAGHVFFPTDSAKAGDDDDVEENIDAAHEWASQWTPVQINNSVYFTYGLLHKRGGVRTKYARFIIGDSDLGQKLNGLRKGKRKILYAKTKKKMKKKMKNKKKVLRLKEDGKCKKLQTKKYRMRNSPSFSAQSCPNMKKRGNDGNYYMSSQNKSNIYSWKRV